MKTTDIVAEIRVIQSSLDNELKAVRRLSTLIGKILFTTISYYNIVISLYNLMGSIENDAKAQGKILELIYKIQQEKEYQLPCQK